ncbi:hypothetical protein F5Y15DRAFT_287943 [Xylariaceae sp. FL0016]|nr:hypothetical protein F5Y15DRAFT_287943 [Xylariaceae sp. FL0016]
MVSNAISIAVIGTLDTKLEEFLYLRSRILHLDPSINIILIDAGRSDVSHEFISISQSEVLKASGHDGSTDALPRGDVIKIMIKGAIGVAKPLHAQGKIQGIVSLGGSGGTSIASAVMRELPLAFPKLLVSTVASGDTSSYVAESDITMMYSVVDIAGLNAMLRAVVDNAAAAIVGMTRAYVARAAADGGAGPGKQKRGIGVTMFGVTTPAVDVARARLDSQGFEVYVFHATGAGGRAMERLVQEGRLDAVLDLTTTELADELAGGVMSAGPDRLTAAAKAGIPQIVSVGAMDMVNFGPRDSIPENLQSRTLFEHNPSVTLMRTSPEECAELGRRLSSRLKQNCKEPSLIEVWLPRGGVSAIAVKGQAFHDSKADEGLFGAIKDGLQNSGIKVVENESDINNAHFAESIACRLKELIDSRPDD